MNGQKEPVRKNADDAAAGSEDRLRAQIAEELFFVNLALRLTCRTLADVYSIGQIIKSDGCSDFRQKRDGMKEVCGDISGAIWEIGKLLPLIRQQDEELEGVKSELEALLDFVQPIPESISDVMKDTYIVDCKVDEAGELLAPICDRLDQIKAKYESSEISLESKTF